MADRPNQLRDPNGPAHHHGRTVTTCSECMRQLGEVRLHSGALFDASVPYADASRIDGVAAELTREYAFSTALAVLGQLVAAFDAHEAVQRLEAWHAKDAAPLASLARHLIQACDWPARHRALAAVWARNEADRAVVLGLLAHAAGGLAAIQAPRPTFYWAWRTLVAAIPRIAAAPHLHRAALISSLLAAGDDDEAWTVLNCTPSPAWAAELTAWVSVLASVKDEPLVYHDGGLLNVSVPDPANSPPLGRPAHIMTGLHDVVRRFREGQFGPGGGQPLLDALGELGYPMRIVGWYLAAWHGRLTNHGLSGQGGVGNS